MPPGLRPQSASISVEPSRRSLPHHLRLLCIGPDQPPWSLVALRLESAGCDDAEFEWHEAAADALTALRTHSFDVVVIQDVPAATHSESLTIRLVEAIRAGGTEDPIAVILTHPDDDKLVQLEECECEILVSVHGWQSRALGGTIRRAVCRGNTRRNVSALEDAARRGRIRNRDEANAQLRQLQGLIACQRGAQPDAAQAMPATGGQRPSDLSSQIDSYYRELLRTYVMMGSGTLEKELQELAEILSLSGTTLHETMAIHLKQLESLISGLGNRSSRHIMARADLLALELMIRLGECYRVKSRFRGLGDNGVDLLHAQTLLR